MNTPMGFIGAMFEPCETKSQAFMTAFFMLIVAAGAVAVGYACYLYGEGMRLTLLEEQAGEFDIGDRNRGGVYQYMFVGYAAASVVGLFALLMVACAVIAPIRTCFPNARIKREDVLR